MIVAVKQLKKLKFIFFVFIPCIPFLVVTCTFFYVFQIKFLEQNPNILYSPNQLSISYAASNNTRHPYSSALHCLFESAKIHQKRFSWKSHSIHFIAQCVIGLTFHIFQSDTKVKNFFAILIDS